MRYYLLLLLTIALLLLTGCNTVWDEMGPEINTEIDSEGFYTTQEGNFILKYKVINSNDLQCKLTGSGTGWVAVGFDPTAQMKDSNFIIGYYDSNGGSISDEFGVTAYSHEADTAIGGTNNITLFSSSETGGETTIEFTIPLNSGDSKDRVLAIGESYNVIFASGAEDDFTTIHTEYAFGAIQIRD